MTYEFEPLIDSKRAAPQAGDLSSERHLSIAEIAATWNLSQDVVRRLFEKEPGVLVVETARRYKRRYRTLRIPESVVQRVHKKKLCP